MEWADVATLRIEPTWYLRIAVSVLPGQSRGLGVSTVPSGNTSSATCVNLPDFLFKRHLFRRVLTFFFDIIRVAGPCNCKERNQKGVRPPVWSSSEIFHNGIRIRREVRSVSGYFETQFSWKLPGLSIRSNVCAPKKSRCAWIRFAGSRSLR